MAGERNNYEELYEAITLYQPLQRGAILSYGVGHMLNDITSACWFTYLLLFLTDIGLSPRDAAIVMLSGQIADALMTVFAGELVQSFQIYVILHYVYSSDAYCNLIVVCIYTFTIDQIDRFGNFKLWHAGGSALVAISFSSVFGGCMLCKLLGTNSSMMQTIGYSVFAAIFNVGWAATQVSHMSMVNCITLNPTSRVALASCRNAFTMIANLCLFAVALAVFSLYDTKSSSDVEAQYRWIAYISIFVGCCFVAVFFHGTKEPKLKQEIQCKSPLRISWAHWFRKALYYQVAMVYMLCRLITNVSQALLAFYVINDLKMAQSSKALVPAIIYVCSFLVSIVLQEIKWTGSRLKMFFTAGAVMWIACGNAIFLLPSAMHDLMYLLSIVTGIANALMLVTVVGMEGILVGEDLNGCAFVYGSLSFLDKLSCGIALYLLETYQDISGCQDIHGCQSVTRYGSGLIPALCALLSLVFTYFMELPEHEKPENMPLLA